MFEAYPLCALSELYTLLLEDILVLLQKQDERLILKCQSKNLAGSADTKHIFSPIIKLNTVLVRSVATGRFRCLFPVSFQRGLSRIQSNPLKRHKPSLYILQTRHAEQNYG